MLNGRIPPRKARYQGINTYIGDLRREIGLYYGWIRNYLATNQDGDDIYETLRYDETVATCSSHAALRACGKKINIVASDERLQYV